MVRCFFNDSYEVFGANATPDLPSEFLRRRGYDLLPHLAALNEKDDSDTARRVRADYRATMGELLHDHFLAPWTDWAKSHGAQTRQQAHGSPGKPTRPVRHRRHTGDRDFRSAPSRQSRD